MREPPEIALDPAEPDLPGVVVARPTPDEAIDAACADLFLQCQGCVRAFGDFHLAIDPGDAPLALVMRLMVDPLYRDLPWASAHVWVTADGPHPPDDERSGYHALAGLLGEHAGMPAGQLHPIPIGSPKPDEAYEADLRRCLGWRDAGHERLDFVLMGVNAEGELGGLGREALDAREHLAVREGERVSMTLDVLNAARCLAVLALGERAGAHLRSTGDAAPASRLAPLAGELRWYLDHDACTGATA